MPLPSCSKSILTLLAPALLLPAMAAQDLQKPPDFGRQNLTISTEAVQKAWSAWQASNKDLELQVYRVPMTEARARIQAAFSDLVAFLEKRRAYTDGVLRTIESSLSEAVPAQPVASAEAVSADQIELMGMNIVTLQKKLDSLRDKPDWARIRRAVQANRAEILELQEFRRQDVQVDRPLNRAASASSRPVSSIVYGEAERQTREALQKLWTRYYQALVDSVEQKPGSTPLIVSANPHALSEGLVTPVPVLRGMDNPWVGTWTYVDGSQQFNGIAEPQQVILEIWMDKGVLAGRYRAQLPDFEETRQVDLTLRGKPISGRTQTLEFDSPEWKVGKILLQGPGPNGIDLMLVRSVEPGGPLPRGRELLNRR